MKIKHTCKDCGKDSFINIYKDTVSPFCFKCIYCNNDNIIYFNYNNGLKF